MAWLSTSWQYRKSHQINPASGAGTGYQKRIKAHYGSGTDSGEDVYLNSHCRTDFGDVRFTDDDGTTLLNYWMEEKVDGNYAIFWVKVNDDLSTTAQTIYIYYGNPNATTTSNIKATSLWNQGDDFDDNSRDTALWDELKKGTGVPYEQNQRLECYVPASGDISGFVSVNYFAINNAELKVYLKRQTVDVVDFFIHTQKITNDEPHLYDHWYRILLYRDGYLYVQKRVSGTITNLYYAAYLVDGEIVKMRIKDSTIEFYEQDTLRASDTWALPTRNCYIIFTGIGYTSHTGTAIVDTFFPRKYVDPEPSHGTWGAEETITQILISDSGVGTDTVSIKSAVSVQDSGIGTDTISAITAKVPITDSGVGTDTILKIPQISVLDSGLGTETIEIGLTKLVQDSGIGTDTISAITAKVPITDSGVGTDVIGISKPVFIQDSGIGVDTLITKRPIFVSDSGLGTETIKIVLAKFIQDSGLGTDSILRTISISLLDSAIGTDLIEKRITYQPTIYDYEDFSRPVLVASYRTDEETIWDEKEVYAGEATDPIDVSSFASLGIFIRVTSPTTAKIQKYTVDGWQDYHEYTFTSAGSIFFEFWQLSFRKMRILFTDQTTATVQISYRT